MKELHLLHIRDLESLPDIKFTALRKFRIVPNTFHIQNSNAFNDSLAKLQKTNPDVKFEITKPWSRFGSDPDPIAPPSSEPYDDQYLD